MADYQRIENYDDDLFEFDDKEEGDRPVLIAASELARLRQAAKPKGVPNLEDRIRQAKSVEEVMALANEAGLPTTWNRPA